MQHYFFPPADLFLNWNFSFPSLCKSLLQFLAAGGNLIQILTWPALLVLCNHSPVEFIIVQPSNLKERNGTARPDLKKKKCIYSVSLENEEMFISG